MATERPVPRFEYEVDLLGQVKTRIIQEAEVPSDSSKDMTSYVEDPYGDAPKGIEILGLIVVSGVIFVLEKVGQVRQSLERLTLGKKDASAKFPRGNF